MIHLAIVTALAVASCGSAAAQAADDPASPSTAAPAPRYRSVFRDLPTGVEEEQLDWKAANADVARFARGHADYLKWEEQQAGPGRPAAGPPAIAAPAPRPPGHRH